MQLTRRDGATSAAPAASRAAGVEVLGDEPPEDFAERYQAAYRVTYRLLGDADAARAITRSSLASSDAALMPRADRTRVVRTCRAAAASALRSASGEAGPFDDRGRLRRALRSLPARQRAVFVLIRVAELPATDVAAALGMIPAWCDEQLQSAEQRVGLALGSPLALAEER